MSLVRLLEEGVASEVFPGAACAVGNSADYEVGVVGRHRYDPTSRQIGEDSVWDLASLTKVIFTTTLARDLVKSGRLNLDSRVPEVGAIITYRDLLAHRSGLPAHCELWNLVESQNADLDTRWQAALRIPLEVETGTQTIYSCIGFIVLAYSLGGILAGARSADTPTRLQALESKTPCGFLHRPGPELAPKCVPTEDVHGYREGVLQGEVHDENSHFLGGISGNAGLFGTIDSTARFALKWLRDARSGTCEEWITPDRPGSNRGLGWMVGKQGTTLEGTTWSDRSFGHTGFTGTSIWIDPEADQFVVLLTNRVHPTRANTKIQEFRPRFHVAVRKLI